MARFGFILVAIVSACLVRASVQAQVPDLVDSASQLTAQVRDEGSQYRAQYGEGPVSIDSDDEDEQPEKAQPPPKPPQKKQNRRARPHGEPHAFP